EPRFYAQAAKHPEWINAMKAEIQALESNKTWDITSLPEGKKAIRCRWVYKLKLKPDGTIDRYKARLVAISYNQVEGVDFIESFSPVAKAVKVRPMLAVAASEGWTFSLQTAKPTTTPLPAGIKFSAQADSALPQPAIYRQLIRRLLYLSFTRPDLSHATQQLMQILQTPCKQHWDAIVHLVRYLKGTPQKGLFFPSGTPLNLKAYCDANWASCMDTRRSLTGYCIFLGPALIF
ncbi:UNVERIFIED_CONTAM: putative mitochondrial protein, partial [Sesamum radiatum]